ncbi:MAG: MDR family MFS transporter [Devosia sp.]|nr:MDR family MFS transporter [Devosia sp.]
MTMESTANPELPAVAPSHASHAARNSLVINLLLVSAFVVMLNETIMNVAIPTIKEAFGVPASSAQWLTTAFLLTMAVVIPITGFLLQRLHTRPVFILAMSLFSVGTALAIVAPSLELLVFARVVQASGTAVMMPLLMTTIMTLVPPEQRGKMMGNISLVMSLAPAAGPVVAGVILNFLPWRFLFILVLPIALLALALGARRMVNVTTPRYAPLDVFSVIVSAFAFGGIVYGLSGFASPAGAADAMSVWVPLIVGLLAMAIFIWRQLALQKTSGPLLDLRTFRSYNFTVSNIMFVIGMASMFGSLNLLPYYLQNVLKLDPLYIGLILLPGGLMMAMLGPFVGRLYDRVGPKPLIIPGIILVSIVLWAMTLLGTGTWWPLIVAGYLLMCVGFSFLFGPLFTLSLGSVKPELYSHGSALLGSIQQVSGAAGVALLIAIMSSQAATLTAAGNVPVEALAGGIRMAFLSGAILSLFAVAAAFFIRKPEPHPGPAGLPGH